MAGRLSLANGNRSAGRRQGHTHWPAACNIRWRGTLIAGDGLAAGAHSTNQSTPASEISPGTSSFSAFCSLAKPAIIQASLCARYNLDSRKAYFYSNSLSKEACDEHTDRGNQGVFRQLYLGCSRRPALFDRGSRRGVRGTGLARAPRTLALRPAADPS